MAVCDVVESLEELHRRTLSTSGASDEGDRLSLLHFQIQPFEYDDSWTSGIGELNFTELNGSVAAALLGKTFDKLR